MSASMHYLSCSSIGLYVRQLRVQGHRTRTIAPPHPRLQQVPAGSSSLGLPPNAVDPPLAARLAHCADLASIHALLLEQAGTAQAGTLSTHLAAWTRPSDAVAAFGQLAASWSNSAQRPLDAATLSDALQHAYALLNVHMHSLLPRETGAIIMSLAELRSASPEVLRQLAESLMRRPAQTYAAPQPQPPSPSAPSTSPSPSPSPSAGAPRHAPSSAPGLSRLPSHELAGVVSALASFNVRPSDAWLGLCTSSLQLGLPYLSGPQLAQLLWALVQLGVRPTSPWLALFEEALSASLDRHLQGGAAEAAAAEGQGGWHGGEASVANAVAQPPHSHPQPHPQPHAQQQQQQAVAVGELSCEDLVRVTGAAAEVGFQPGERCRALLLASVGSRLGVMQPHQVAGLAWGLTRLRWLVDEQWRLGFLQVTAALLPRLKATDLPPVLAFVAAARLDPDPRWVHRCLEASFAHLPQCSPRDLPDLLWDLTALDQQLFARSSAPGAPAAPAPAAAAPAAAIPIVAGGEEASGLAASPLNAAGGEAAARGVQDVASERERERERRDELEVLADAWLRRYLQQCSDKLSRFTASGVARMMLAVARTNVRQTDEAWLQAACAALASKSDVLAPSDLADAVTALAILRHRPTTSTRPPAAAPPPLPSAASAHNPVPPSVRLGPGAPCRSRGPQQTTAAPSTAAAAAAVAAATAAAPTQQGLLEVLLAGCATKLSLLPDDRLVGLATAVASLDVRPDPTWLGALLDETGMRLEAAAAAAAAGTPPPAGRLTPRLLSELLVAVAKLDVVPPRPWQRAFLLAAGRQLPAFDSAALGGLLWGLVVLDVRPPAGWTRRLMEHVHERLEEGSARAGAGAGAGRGLGPDGALAWAGSDGSARDTAGSHMSYGSYESYGSPRAARGGVRLGAAAPAPVAVVVSEGEEGLGLFGGVAGEGGSSEAEGSRVGSDGRDQGAAWQRGPRRRSYGYLSGPYSRTLNRRAATGARRKR